MRRHIGLRRGKGQADDAGRDRSSRHAQEGDDAQENTYDCFHKNLREIKDEG